MILNDQQKKDLENKGLQLAEALGYNIHNPTNITAINVGDGYCKGYTDGHDSRDTEVSSLQGEIKELVNALKYWVGEMEASEWASFRIVAKDHKKHLLSKYNQQ